MNTTANGDIVFLGRIFSECQGFENSDFAVIGRIDSNGSIKWIRYIGNPDEPANFSNLDYIIETSDGGLLASGKRRDSDDDGHIGNVWLLKLDSMGCFTPGCTQEILFFEGDSLIQVPTATEEIFTNQLDYFSIAPNPVDDLATVTWQQPFEQENSFLKIYSIEGKLAQQTTLPLNATQVELNMSNLTKGLYIFVLEINGQVVQREKIMKF